MTSPPPSQEYMSQSETTSPILLLTPTNFPTWITVTRKLLLTNGLWHAATMPISPFPAEPSKQATFAQKDCYLRDVVVHSDDKSARRLVAEMMLSRISGEAMGRLGSGLGMEEMEEDGYILLGRIKEVFGGGEVGDRGGGQRNEGSITNWLAKGINFQPSANLTSSPSIPKSHITSFKNALTKGIEFKPSTAHISLATTPHHQTSEDATQCTLTQPQPQPVDPPVQHEIIFSLPGDLARQPSLLSTAAATWNSNTTAPSPTPTTCHNDQERVGVEEAQKPPTTAATCDGATTTTTAFPVNESAWNEAEESRPSPTGSSCVQNHSGTGPWYVNDDISTNVGCASQVPVLCGEEQWRKTASDPHAFYHQFLFVEFCRWDLANPGEGTDGCGWGAGGKGPGRREKRRGGKGKGKGRKGKER
ncbi:hypothetical protein BJ875DRAFT_440994 [Amylocarpus encephaloides]|uniref:DUF4219 domain-containing protein n=1 Tax=Amylocarpus encephaloides TaxID=45428 RepID=A0A9P8C5J1_9HELO|nr:hypothetical protein BJ875DRAFT_440994 [Amylocarpus encephaloides]